MTLPRPACSGSKTCLLPAPLSFDHANILADYFRFKKTGKRPL